MSPCAYTGCALTGEQLCREKSVIPAGHQVECELAVTGFGPSHAREISTNCSESNEEQLKGLRAGAHDAP